MEYVRWATRPSDIPSLLRLIHHRCGFSEARNNPAVQAGPVHSCVLVASQPLRGHPAPLLSVRNGPVLGIPKGFHPDFTGTGQSDQTWVAMSAAHYGSAAVTIIISVLFIGVWGLERGLRRQCKTGFLHGFLTRGFPPCVPGTAFCGRAVVGVELLCECVYYLRYHLASSEGLSNRVEA